MPNISIIQVNGIDYQIKDSTTATDLANLIDMLGTLAYKDSASGSFTPSGTVTTPTITAETSSKQIKEVNSVGALPSLTTTVTGETLKFNWNPGSLPTTTTTSVITNVTNLTSSKLTFTGTEGSVTVS